MKQRLLAIDGACLLVAEPFGDHRGRFTRLLCTRELGQLGLGAPFVQVNHSLTREPGTVRGLHYQVAPSLEAKLVTCLRGRVYDVLVDLRAGSRTFLRWEGVELSAEAPVLVYVPEGCAHGFQVLQADSELLYFHSCAYSAKHERGIRPDDPALAIRWPLPVTNLSDRDRRHPMLAAGFVGVATGGPAPGISVEE